MPLAVSINQAAHLLGISRSSVYVLAKAGHLPIRKSGRRSLILTDDIRSYLSSLSAELDRQ